VPHSVGGAAGRKENDENVRQLNAQLDAREKQVNDALARVKELQARVEQVEMEKDDVSDERDRAAAECDSLKASAQETAASLQRDADDERARSEAALAKKERKIEKYRGKQKKLADAARAAMAKLEEQREQIAQLEADVGALNGQLAEAKSQLSDKATSGGEQAKKIGELEQQVASLSDEHARAIAALKDEHEKAAAAPNDEHAKATAALKDEHKQAVAALNDDHERAMATLSTEHKEALAALKSKQDDAGNEVRAKLKHQLAALEKQKAALAAKVETLERDASAREATLKGEHEKQLDALSKRHAKEAGKHEKRLESAEAERRALADRHDETLAELKAERDRIAALEGERDDALRRFETARDELKRHADGANLALGDQAKAREARIAELQASLDAAEASVAEAERDSKSARGEADAAEEARVALQTRVDALEARVADAKKSARERSAEIDELKSKLAQAQESGSDELASVRARVRALEAERRAAQEVASAADAAAATAASPKGDNDDEEEEAVAAADKDDLRSSPLNPSASSELLALEESLKSEQATVQRVSRERDDALESLGQAREQLQMLLNDSGVGGGGAADAQVTLLRSQLADAESRAEQYKQRVDADQWQINKLRTKLDRLSDASRSQAQSSLELIEEQLEALREHRQQLEQSLSHLAARKQVRFAAGNVVSTGRFDVDAVPRKSSLATRQSPTRTRFVASRRQSPTRSRKQVRFADSSDDEQQPPPSSPLSSRKAARFADSSDEEAAAASARVAKPDERGRLGRQPQPQATVAPGAAAPVMRVHRRNDNDDHAGLSDDDWAADRDLVQQQLAESAPLAGSITSKMISWFGGGDSDSDSNDALDKALSSSSPSSSSSSTVPSSSAAAAMATSSPSLATSSSMSKERRDQVQLLNAVKEAAEQLAFAAQSGSSPASTSSFAIDRFAPALLGALQLEFKSWKLWGEYYVWDAVTQGADAVASANLSAVAMRSAAQRIDKLHDDDDPDRKFAAFVCESLNSAALSAWLAALFSEPSFLKFFDDYSIVADAWASQQLIAIVHPLSAAAKFELSLY
jgi:RUN domain